MPIALVGVAGAVATSAASPVTPSFGQATTAANFLLAFAWTAPQTAITTPTGWSLFGNGGNNGAFAGMFFKANCSVGETAPSFVSAGATSMAAQLLEFQGVKLVSPTQSFGPSAGAGVGSSITATDSTLDQNAGQLMAAFCISTYAAASTPVLSLNVSNSSGIAPVDDGTTSSTLHRIWGWAITTTNSSGKTWTVVSSAAWTSALLTTVRFLPAFAPQPAYPDVNAVGPISQAG